VVAEGVGKKRWMMLAILHNSRYNYKVGGWFSSVGKGWDSLLYYNAYYVTLLWDKKKNVCVFRV